MQPELTEPVALLIDEPLEVHDAATAYGYRVFKTADALRSYCDNLMLTGAVSGGSVDDAGDTVETAGEG